jgi:hypothetical protein
MRQSSRHQLRFQSIPPLPRAQLVQAAVSLLLLKTRCWSERTVLLDSRCMQPPSQALLRCQALRSQPVQPGTQAAARKSLTAPSSRCCITRVRLRTHSSASQTRCCQLIPHPRPTSQGCRQSQRKLVQSEPVYLRARVRMRAHIQAAACARLAAQVRRGSCLSG